MPSDLFPKAFSGFRARRGSEVRISVTLFVVVAVCMLGLYFNLAAVTNCCFAILLPRTLSNPF
jgi:hypothetical protein